MKSSKKEEIVLTIKDVILMHEAVSKVLEYFPEASKDIPVLVTVEGPLVSLSIGLCVGEDHES